MRAAEAVLAPAVRTAGRGYWSSQMSSKRQPL
jgi:hypothetical protein